MNRTIPCLASTLALTAAALVACTAEPEEGATSPAPAASMSAPATASPSPVAAPTTTSPSSPRASTPTSSPASDAVSTPTPSADASTGTATGTAAAPSGSSFTWRMTPSFPGLLDADEVSRIIEVDHVESNFARGEDYPLSMGWSEASPGCPEALEAFNEAATDVDDTAQVDMRDTQRPIVGIRLAILRDPGMPALADAWDRVADVCQGVPLVPQGPETRPFDEGHGLTFLQDDTDAMGVSLTFRRVAGHPDVLAITQVEATPSIASPEDVSALADAHVQKVRAGLEEMAGTP